MIHCPPLVPPFPAAAAAAPQPAHMHRPTPSSAGSFLFSGGAFSKPGGAVSVPAPFLPDPSQNLAYMTTLYHHLRGLQSPGHAPTIPTSLPATSARTPPRSPASSSASSPTTTPPKSTDATSPGVSPKSAFTIDAILGKNEKAASPPPPPPPPPPPVTSSPSLPAREAAFRFKGAFPGPHLHPQLAASLNHLHPHLQQHPHLPPHHPAALNPHHPAFMPPPTHHHQLHQHLRGGAAAEFPQHLRHSLASQRKEKDHKSNHLKRDCPWKVSSTPSASQASSQLSPTHPSAGGSGAHSGGGSGSGSGGLGVKPKRVRTIFTPEQLERLEQEFERQQYMVGTERFYLATSLNLSEAQVKVWFQNRRIKWRKQHLEQPQQQQHPHVGVGAERPLPRLPGEAEEEEEEERKRRRMAEEEEEVDLESGDEEDVRSLTSSLRSSPGILVNLASAEERHCLAAERGAGRNFE